MGFFELFAESLPLLMEGLGLTLQLSVISLIAAMVIGLISCLMNISKSRILHALSQIYISIIRGTPLLVQAFFIYFGVTGILQIKMTAFVAGIIALALNAGAYLSEIFRGGIQAIPKGQMEAGRSLGLSYGKTMVKIIIPQAIRVCAPSVINQCIITIKDTSIISVIGLAELTKAGQIIIARTYEAFEVWIMVGIIYFIAIYLLTLLSRFIEKRFSLENKAKRKKATHEKSVDAAIEAAERTISMSAISGDEKGAEAILAQGEIAAVAQGEDVETILVGSDGIADSGDVQPAGDAAGTADEGKKGGLA